MRDFVHPCQECWNKILLGFFFQSVLKSTDLRDLPISKAKVPIQLDRSDMPGRSGGGRSAGRSAGHGRPASKPAASRQVAHNHHHAVGHHHHHHVGYVHHHHGVHYYPGYYGGYYYPGGVALGVGAGVALGATAALAASEYNKIMYSYSVLCRYGHVDFPFLTHHDHYGTHFLAVLGIL
jgi:hypothetical protein